MLASFPVSMVNQKLPDLGFPNRFKLKSSRFRLVDIATRLAASNSPEPSCSSKSKRDRWPKSKPWRLDAKGYPARDCTFMQNSNTSQSAHNTLLSSCCLFNLNCAALMKRD
jgi:hypothetical protein